MNDDTITIKKSAIEAAIARAVEEVLNGAQPALSAPVETPPTASPEAPPAAESAPPPAEPPPVATTTPPADAPPSEAAPAPTVAETPAPSPAPAEAPIQAPAANPDPTPQTEPPAAATAVEPVVDAPPAVAAPKPSMEAKAFLAMMADTFEQHPEKWSQGAFARNKDSVPVDATSPDAVSWSANGFLERATGLPDGVLNEEQSRLAYDLFIGAINESFSHREMVRVNDYEGREAVIACARLAAK